MNLTEKLDELGRDISRLDVNSFIPESYSEDVCYLEFSKHVIYRDILNMITQMEEYLLRFMEAFGLHGYVGCVGESTEDRAERIKGLSGMISSSDPFGKTEGVMPKEFVAVSNQMAKEIQANYVVGIKTLSELAWKNEIFGDNIITLQKNLTQACGEMYFNLSQTNVLVGSGISPHTKAANRGGAVLFGKPVTKGLDIAPYLEGGSKMLWSAVNLYYASYKIAEAREDYIQSFRGFRKAVRVRKRFGLPRALVNYFIEKDKEMLELSLGQMGSRIDTVELRKYELQNRAEQQQRNLKYKTVIIRDEE